VDGSPRLVEHAIRRAKNERAVSMTEPVEPVLEA
jgi:hypothetical protein